MSESLTFMMGDFAAEFPTDRLYAKNHMWAIRMEDDIVRFGFSAYAVRLLQDIYFLEFEIETNSEFDEPARVRQHRKQESRKRFVLTDGRQSGPH